MKPYESYDWSSRQSLAAVRTTSNSPGGGRKNVGGGKHNRVERHTPVSNTGIRINNGKKFKHTYIPSKLHDSFCLVIHVIVSPVNKIRTPVSSCRYDNSLGKVTFI
jgi:hypothetical protein